MQPLHFRRDLRLRVVMQASDRVPAELFAGENLAFTPATSQGLNEVDGGDFSLPSNLRVGTLSLQRLAIGVHHFEVAYNAGAIPVGRELRRPAGTGQSAVLCFALNRKLM